MVKNSADQSLGIFLANPQFIGQPQVNLAFTRPGLYNHLQR